jgi:hypothetical protein
VGFLLVLFAINIVALLTEESLGGMVFSALAIVFAAVQEFCKDPEYWDDAQACWCRRKRGGDKDN